MAYTIERPNGPVTHNSRGQLIPRTVTRKTAAGADGAARKMLHDITHAWPPADFSIEWFAPDMGVMSAHGVNVYVRRDA